MRRELTSLPDGRVVDAIIGYRSWRFRGVDGEAQLSSLFEEEPWYPKRVKRAECRCAARRALRVECGCDECVESMHAAHTCGIYALHAPERYTLPNYVSGEVALFGEVVVHSRGYRAEFALITAVDWRRLSRVAAELAALTFDVPLVRREV